MANFMHVSKSSLDRWMGLLWPRRAVLGDCWNVTVVCSGTLEIESPKLRLSQP